MKTITIYSIEFRVERRISRDEIAVDYPKLAAQMEKNGIVALLSVFRGDTARLWSVTEYESGKYKIE